MCDCEMRLKNLSATGGGCVGARVAGGSPGAATRSSRGMRVRLAPATLAGVSRNARGNRVGRAGRCDWSGTGHSPEELAIGDVRLKLDPLLVEASPAVDGERIHVLRRAHVPAGGEDQAWYGRKGKRRGVSEGRRRGQKVKNRAGEFSGRFFERRPVEGLAGRVLTSLRDQPLIARQVDHLGVNDRFVAVCRIGKGREVSGRREPGRSRERQKISKGEVEKKRIPLAVGGSGKARTCILATRRARHALLLTLGCLLLDGFQRLALLPGRVSIRGALELGLERLSGNIAPLASGDLRDDVRPAGDRGVLLPGRSRARRDGHLFLSDSLRTRLGDLTRRAPPLSDALAVVGDVPKGRLFPLLHTAASSRAHHRFRPSPPRA